MGAVNISPLALPALQPESLGRNGQVVTSTAMRGIAQSANQVLRWRTKELFSTLGRIDTITASAGVGPTTIYRAYCHTGPMVAQVRWYVLLARPTGSGGTPSATITITATNGSAIGSGTAYTNYGGTANDVPSEYSESTGVIVVDPDKSILITLAVANNARLISACIYEENKKPSTANGYYDDSFASTQSIYNTDRSLVTASMKDYWLKGGAHLLNWSGVLVNGTAVDTNIIDGTSTTVSVNSPGYSFDMRYKARLKDSAVGINCNFAVYGAVDSGTAGNVKIKNSAGTVLATVSGFTTTAAWQTANLVLPATMSKYDITASTAASTLHISDVSLYELG